MHVKLSLSDLAGTWDISENVDEFLRAKLAICKLDIILARVYCCTYHCWKQQTKLLVRKKKNKKKTPYILYNPFLVFGYRITLTFEAWLPLPVTA